MNFAEPFVRRPVMTMVATASVVVFGVLSYFRLPVNDLPGVDYPVIQVSVGYPGASPETVANTIAAPLERQFMQINGLVTVTSNSRQGFASLTLEFSLEKNIDAAATDVQTAISQASALLPADLPSPPSLSKTNPNDQPILYIALTSDSVTAGRLYDYASTEIGQQISIVNGVSRVQVFGTKSAIRIKADPSAMASRGLSMEEVSEAIRAGTAMTGAGQFDDASGTAVLRPHGQLDSAEAYANLIVRSRDGATVRLGDVARVVDSVQDERMNMRFWARGFAVPKATVVIAVNRRAGANTVEVAKAVREILPEAQKLLPAAVRVTTIYDRSYTIVRSVLDVQETLLIAFVLVVVVIFAFLGRAGDTLIPAVALPMSLLITFIVMRFLGYSIDNLSLMALTLAIGFLVDDAIVFLENTVRRMERGEAALEATLNSAREISFTIISMTVSLAAVFIPLVFMSGLMGRIFREFAITIVVAIFASGLVSLTLTPLMCSRMLRDRGAGAKKTWMERVVGGFEKRVLAVYGRSLWWFLRWRWISAVIWVACLAGTLWLFARVPKGFLPQGDSGTIFGLIVGREGASPQQMREIQGKVDQVIQSNPNVRAAFTATGIGGFMASNRGITFIQLGPQGERPPIELVTLSLQMPILTIPGGSAYLGPMPVLQIATGATSNAAQGQYSYSVSGVNDTEVYATAGKLMMEFFAHWGPGKMFRTVLPDLNANTPNLDVVVKRDQARTYGVSETRILNLLRTAYSQNYLYLIKTASDQYQVILEVEDEARSQPDHLGLLYIRSDDGSRLVPLRALVDWQSSVGMQSVNHLNQFPSVTFSFNLNPGRSIGEATELIEEIAARVVPPTLRASHQGEALTFRQTVEDFRVLLLVAVFVMYVILAILYESYLHPLTVLSSLPVALVGGLMTLVAFGEVATLYAYVGMFMLMGIVKKNGIMIIDFAIHRVAAGEPADKAIHDASMDRFRPIMMTTIAAVIGAVPIALGWGADGASRRPLGLVVVGGLIVSQFITLYITPVIYLYLERFQERVLDRSSFFRSSHARALAEGGPDNGHPAPVQEKKQV